MVSIPDPFFAILSHSPSEVVWCFSSHVSHTSREVNGIVGSSGFLVDMASPFRLPVLLRGVNCGESRRDRLVALLVISAGKPCQKFTRLADRKSTRLNSSHANISYAVFCLKKKKQKRRLCVR